MTKYKQLITDYMAYVIHNCRIKLDLPTVRKIVIGRFTGFLEAHLLQEGIDLSDPDSASKELIDFVKYFNSKSKEFIKYNGLERYRDHAHTT